MKGYAPKNHPPVAKVESKKLKVTRNTVIAQTIAKLKPGVTYYVHIRTYKTIGSVNYYSAWSKKLPVKIFKK